MSYRKNIYTRAVILTGWTPIVGAVIIEQPSGVVMDNAFSNYDVMLTFHLLVDGNESLISLFNSFLS
jgi:hypothetical protein